MAHSCAPQRLCVWPCREESIAIPVGQKGVIFMFFVFFWTEVIWCAAPTDPGSLCYLSVSLYLVYTLSFSSWRRSERGPQKGQCNKHCRQMTVRIRKTEAKRGWSGWAAESCQTTKQSKIWTCVHFTHSLHNMNRNHNKERKRGQLFDRGGQVILCSLYFIRHWVSKDRYLKEGVEKGREGARVREKEREREWEEAVFGSMDCPLDCPMWPRGQAVDVNGPFFTTPSTVFPLVSHWGMRAKRGIRNTLAHLFQSLICSSFVRSFVRSVKEAH